MHLALLCRRLQLCLGQRRMLGRSPCAALGTGFLSVSLKTAVTAMVQQQQQSKEKSLAWEPFVEAESLSAA